VHQKACLSDFLHDLAQQVELFDFIVEFLHVVVVVDSHKHFGGLFAFADSFEAVLSGDDRSYDGVTSGFTLETHSRKNSVSDRVLVASLVDCLHNGSVRRFDTRFK